jgi:hypothetical protein
MARWTALAELDQLLAYLAELDTDGRLACDRDLRAGLGALGRALEDGTGRTDAVIAAFWRHALERAQARYGAAATARALEGERARLLAGSERAGAGNGPPGASAPSSARSNARSVQRGPAAGSGSIWNRAPAHRPRSWPTRWSGRPGVR